MAVGGVSSVWSEGVVMVNIFTFLLSAAWPIVKKVLASLGIGFLAYEGLSLIAGQLQSEILA